MIFIIDKKTADVIGIVKTDEPIEINIRFVTIHAKAIKYFEIYSSNIIMFRLIDEDNYMCFNSDKLQTIAEAELKRLQYGW